MLAKKKALLQKFEKHWESKTTISLVNPSNKMHTLLIRVHPKKGPITKGNLVNKQRVSYKGSCTMHIVSTQDFGLLWAPPSTLLRTHSPFWPFCKSLKSIEKAKPQYHWYNILPTKCTRASTECIPQMTHYGRKFGKPWTFLPVSLNPFSVRQCVFLT